MFSVTFLTIDDSIPSDLPYSSDSVRKRLNRTMSSSDSKNPFFESGSFSERKRRFPSVRVKSLRESHKIQEREGRGREEGEANDFVQCISQSQSKHPGSG